MLWPSGTGGGGMGYEATWASVRAHRVPAWFDDAKLGVFLHWGLFSVPAWAPRVADIQTLLREKGPAWMLRHNPYAEWYANSMALPGSPTRRHHDEVWGADRPYGDFRAPFEAASSGADLEALAGACREAGARYVVLTTKHHEGYCLWPSALPHRVLGPYHSPRDLVGELAAAVRARGMRMGLYYSGGYDWPWNGAVLARLADALLAVPTDPAYAAYAEGQVRELIDRYRPEVLWNDIGWPAASDLPALFAHYYDAVPEGVVNDRWLQATRRGAAQDAAVRAAGWAVQRAWPLVPARYKQLTFPGAGHADFRTPEYATGAPGGGKWEATRGVGHSFGANHHEDPADVITGPALVRLLVDVVARNGNLLIGVGPAPDGTVPAWQLAPLRDLGRWLAANGDAVYGTRPWDVPAGTTADGTPVRFTRGPGALFATLLEAPGRREVVLEGVAADGTVEVRLLGGPALATAPGDRGLTVTLPERLEVSPAHVLALSPPEAVRPVG